MGLPAQEYQNRVGSVRQAMSEQGIDALLVYSWKRGAVRYVSGYYPGYVANVALVVVPREGNPTLLVRFPFDLARARRMSWIADVRGSGDWAGLAHDCRTILSDWGVACGRLGLVGGDTNVDEMPHSFHQLLRESLPDAEFVPAVAMLDRLRLKKSPAERVLMVRSALVADAAMQAAAQAFAPGRSEFEVAAAAEGTARAMGAEDSLFVIAPAGKELIGPPEDRRIEPDEMAVLEFAVQVDGYWTQVPRVFHAGVPTPEQCEMYEVAYRAYLVGVDAARPGTAVADVAKAELGALERAGWLSWLESVLGLGAGLDHPEIPAITPTSEACVEAGMALCIHPGLDKPGVGGVFVGGTVLIEEDRTTPLHRFPATLAEGIVRSQGASA